MNELGCVQSLGLTLLRSVLKGKHQRAPEQGTHLPVIGGDNTGLSSLDTDLYESFDLEA